MADSSNAPYTSLREDPQNDGVEVIYVTREELLARRAAVEAELAQIRSMRTERECLDELDQISFLLCEPESARAG